jgi:hypothetical protein
MGMDLLVDAILVSDDVGLHLRTYCCRIRGNNFFGWVNKGLFFLRFRLGLVFLVQLGSHSLQFPLEMLRIGNGKLR